MDNFIWQRPQEADDEIEQRIYRLMAKKKIQKSFREIKAYDRIEDSQEDKWNTAEHKNKRDQEPWYYMLPFIREGVVRESAGSEASVWIYFRVEKDDIQDHLMEVYMELYSFQKRAGIFSCIGRFSMSCHVEETLESCRFSIQDLGSGKDLLMEFQKMDDKDHFLRREERELLEYRISAWNDKATALGYKESANLLLQLMEHLNILMAEAPVEEKTSNKEDTTSQMTKRKGRSAKRNDKPAVVYIGGTKIVRAASGSQIEIRKKRVVNRYTKSWCVRGHLRHCKNGKVVMVRPYEKGFGRVQRKQKIYRAK